MKTNLPGFNAEVSIYRSQGTYLTSDFGDFSETSAGVQPQFRRQVRLTCSPCRNGRKTCFLAGYECSVREGTPGSPDLGIPPSPGYISCEPATWGPERVVSC